MTQREQRIQQLMQIIQAHILRGHQPTNTELADALCVSVSTVKSYLRDLETRRWIHTTGESRNRQLHLPLPDDALTHVRAIEKLANAHQHDLATIQRHRLIATLTARHQNRKEHAA